VGQGVLTDSRFADAGLSRNGGALHLGGVQRPESLAYGPRVIDVDRRADLVGDGRERHGAQLEGAVPSAETGVGEQAVGQYALAHTASAALGRSHHMQVVGASGERNSSSGSTRMVALVCSLISVSHSTRPQ
jgi:hypothetical protein